MSEEDAFSYTDNTMSICEELDDAVEEYLEHRGFANTLECFRSESRHRKLLRCAILSVRHTAVVGLSVDCFREGPKNSSSATQTQAHRGSAALYLCVDSPQPILKMKRSAESENLQQKRNS